MVASSVRNFKVPIVKMGTLQTVNMDTVTPIGEGRCNLTHFMYCMNLIQKHFSQKTTYLGVTLDSEKSVFLWKV